MKTPARSLVIGFLLIASCAFAQDASRPGSVAKIGSSSVWQVPPDFFRNAQTTCQKGAGPMSFPACFMNQIASSAPPAAASFSRMLFEKDNGNVGMMTAYKDYGSVGAAQVIYPLRANDNYALLLVNGDPNLIDVDDLKKLDRAAMEKDPKYQALKKKYPQADLWPGDRSGNNPWPRVKAASGGGTQFIVAYPLINGCHACARVGYARFAWELDSSGKFLRTTYISSGKNPRIQYIAEIRPGS